MNRTSNPQVTIDHKEYTELLAAEAALEELQKKGNHIVKYETPDTGRSYDKKIYVVSNPTTLQKELIESIKTLTKEIDTLNALMGSKYGSPEGLCGRIEKIYEHLITSKK